MIIGMQKKAVIIGAGLAGCFMAVCLSKRGYKVDVYEKLSKEELTQAATNRSFNLTFYYRGTEAFKKVGLWKTIGPVLRVLEGSYAHSAAHGTAYSKFDTVHKPQFVVERPKLLEVMIDAAAAMPGVTFHFTTSLLTIDKKEKTITVQDEKSKNVQTNRCDVVFGADGVNSLVRSFIQQGQTTNHSQEFLDWTYKQVRIPVKIAEQFGWQAKSEHFLHGKDAVMVSFPNADGSFTAMVLLPEKAKYTFANLTTEETINAFLLDRFPDQKVAAELFIYSFLHNPEGRLRTIKTSPWSEDDFLVLIGDSAHGLLPFYGQGMSAAFEDCLTIIKLMDEYNEDFGKIFPLYQATRKRDTDVLAMLSFESFERMYKYRQPDINAVHNRLDLILHSLAPKLWEPPIYKMIADDPDNFHVILARHNRRRKVGKFIGLGLAAYSIYGTLLLLHKFNEKK